MFASIILGWVDSARGNVGVLIKACLGRGQGPTPKSKVAAKPGAGGKAKGTTKSKQGGSSSGGKAGGKSKDATKSKQVGSSNTGKKGCRSGGGVQQKKQMKGGATSSGADLPQSEAKDARTDETHTQQQASQDQPMAKKTKKKIDVAVELLAESAAVKPRLSLVVVGHVDAGKSTLMGHLRHLLGHIDQRRMHKLEVCYMV